MIRRLTTLALVAGTALTLFAPSAQAATEAEPKAAVGPAAACHHADPPTMTPGWVHGKGWVTSPCSQTIDVYLQRWRGTWWQKMDIKSFRAPGEAIASWNCSGSGHYTYRTAIFWRDGQDIPRSLISEERRFNC